MDPAEAPGTNRVPFNVSAFLVEPQLNRVSGPDGACTLEPRIMDVLCVLAERAGEVVTRAELIDRLWGVEFGGDESLTRAISQLRKALGDTRDKARVIETISKRGYRLIAPVSPAENSRAARRRLARMPPPWAFVAGGLAAGAVSVLVAFAALPRVAPPPRPAERTGIVLVVRPFTTDSEISSVEFAEGLSTRLARNPLIRVRAEPESAGAAPDSTGTIRYALQGRLRRAGPRLRADVQLVDQTNGDVVWSERFEQPSGAARERLLMAIASEAQFPLLRAAKGKLEARSALDLSPWEATLLVTWVPGAEAQRWAGPPSEDSYWLQRRALELDPDFAPAHALFAELSAYHSLFHPPFDTEAERARARTHAERAFQLAPYDAEVLYQLALYYRFSGQRERAAAMFERVLELHPHHPQARVELAFTRGQCSDTSTDSIREMDALQEEMSPANPVRWVALAHQAEMYLARGEFERAREAALRSRQISPTTWTAIALAAAQAELGEDAAAAATLGPHRREWPALNLAYFADHVVSRWCLGGPQTPQAQASFHRLAAAVAPR